MTYQINFLILLPVFLGAVILFIMFTRWKPIPPFLNFTTGNSNLVSMEYESSLHTQENIESIRNVYLKTMIVTITGYAFTDDPYKTANFYNVNIGGFKNEIRRKGSDWPTIGFTMVGTEALENIRDLCTKYLPKKLRVII